MKEIDFTRGRPAANLVRFGLPVLAANSLQSVDQLVDMLVVGVFVGETGVASLSNATMVGFVVNSFALGLSVAATVLVSRALGSRDPSGASRAEFAALLSAAAVASAAGALLFVFPVPLYSFLGVPGEAVTSSVAYTRVWALGLPASFLVSTAGASLRARGDARTPTALSMVVAVINCMGGIALVPVCGVAGTAWSSTVASLAAACLSVVALQRSRGGQYPMVPLRRDFRDLWSIAVPAAFQQVLVNLSFLAITSMTNAFGFKVAAGAGAATKANTLAGMPVWSIGQAVSAAASRCDAAGDRARAEAYVRAETVISLVATAFVVVPVQLFASDLVALFARDPDSISAGVAYLRVCCSVNAFAYAVAYVLGSFEQATGAARLSAACSVMESVVVRLGLSAALVPVSGFYGILAGQALSPFPPLAVGIAYLFGYHAARRAGGSRHRAD